MEPSQFIDPYADRTERAKPGDYFPLIVFAVGFCMVMGLVISEEFTGPRKAEKHPLPAQVEAAD